MLQPVPPSLPAWLDLFVDSGAEVCYQLPGYIHWLAALRVLYYVCNTALFGNLSSKLVNLPSFLSTLILIMMVMLMTVNLSLVTWFILELLQLFGAASSKKAKLPNARSRIYCSFCLYQWGCLVSSLSSWAWTSSPSTCTVSRSQSISWQNQYLDLSLFSIIFISIVYGKFVGKFST